MPQIEVNCPYCNDEHTVEIEGQSDGDMEDLFCSCGEVFEVEISFSVDGIVYKKENDVVKQKGVKDDIKW